MNLEVLVEEPSAERVLRVLLPKLVPGVPFEIRTFQGKSDLLKSLPNRLKGYAAWIGSTGTKVVVVVDRDDDDCVLLRQQLDKLAIRAGLAVDGAASSGDVLNRIVIEELETWYFGDVEAVRQVYPRIPGSLGERAVYRDPDAVAGGTWEAFERVLKEHGYHVSGLRKLTAADDIAAHMDVEANRSRSFEVFRDGLRRLVSER